MEQLSNEFRNRKGCESSLSASPGTMHSQQRTRTHAAQPSESSNLGRLSRGKGETTHTQDSLAIAVGAVARVAMHSDRYAWTASTVGARFAGVIDTGSRSTAGGTARAHGRGESAGEQCDKGHDPGRNNTHGQREVHVQGGGIRISLHSLSMRYRTMHEPVPVRLVRRVTG